MIALIEIKEKGCEWTWDDTLCRTDGSFETDGLFGIFFKKKEVLDSLSKVQRGKEVDHDAPYNPLLR